MWENYEYTLTSQFISHTLIVTIGFGYITALIPDSFWSFLTWLCEASRSHLPPPIFIYLFIYWTDVWRQHQRIIFLPPCLTMGMVFFSSYSPFLFLQKGGLSWCQKAWFRFHLTKITLLNNLEVHWQTGASVHHSVVLQKVFLVFVVPAALRSLPSSSCVLLVWSTTFLMIILTPNMS